jgi:hypothetical protein
MGSGFTPITMQTNVATQDTGYLRQNQPHSKQQVKNVLQMPVGAPSNEELKTMVSSALELKKQNVMLDRGSILNILA